MNSRIVLDLETDGLLKECTKIHCASVRCAGDQSIISGTTIQEILFASEAIEDFILWLQWTCIERKFEIVGHNIFGFDLRVINKLYGIDLTKTNKIWDTYIMSQVLFSNLKDLDYSQFKDKIPKHLIGKHSLEAWGYRLDCPKQDYQGGFKEYNEEMGKYCSQDTLVDLKIFEYFINIINEKTWK